ncbi:hypothetical protein Efla_000257 [Eimeria flavescens]
MLTNSQLTRNLFSQNRDESLFISKGMRSAPVVPAPQHPIEHRRYAMHQCNSGVEALGLWHDAPSRAQAKGLRRTTETPARGGIIKVPLLTDGNSHRFDPSRSSTYKRKTEAPEQEEMRLTYASGSIDFITARDSLRLQNATCVFLEPPSMQSVLQRVAAFRIHDHLFGALVRQPQHPFAELRLPQDEFAAANSLVQRMARSGEISRARWELRLADILVGNVSLGLCMQAAPCSAIIDSGTSGIGGSALLIEEIIDRSGARFACTGSGLSQSVSFVFEGRPPDDVKVFTLFPSDFAVDLPTGLPSTSCPVAFTALALPPGHSHTIVRMLSAARSFLSVSQPCAGRC